MSPHVQERLACLARSEPPCRHIEIFEPEVSFRDGHQEPPLTLQAARCRHWSPAAEARRELLPNFARLLPPALGGRGGRARLRRE